MKRTRNVSKVPPATVTRSAASTRQLACTSGLAPGTRMIARPMPRLPGSSGHVTRGGSWISSVSAPRLT